MKISINNIDKCNYKPFVTITKGDIIYLYDKKHDCFYEYKVINVEKNRNRILFWYWEDEYTQCYWELEKKHLAKSIFDLGAFIISTTKEELQNYHETFK